MLPYASDLRTDRFSPAAWLLIAANVAGTAAMMAGKLDPAAALLLDGSLARLGLDVVFLWFAARPVEKRLGAMACLLVYAVAGAAALLVEKRLGVAGRAFVPGATAGLVGAWAALALGGRARVFYFLGTAAVGVLTVVLIWAAELGLLAFLEGAPREHALALAAGFGAGGVLGAAGRFSTPEEPGRAPPTRRFVPPPRRRQETPDWW